MKFIYKYLLLSTFLITLFPFPQIAWAQGKNGFILSNSFIPVEEIRRGGPTKDILPILTNPDFLTVGEANYMVDSDRLLGVFTDGVAKAYPIKILNYHEIINDKTHRKSFVICFCPLCGTGYAFLSKIDGLELEFGASGLLHENEIILYDKNTGSLWSQELRYALSGFYRGEEMRPLSVVHTTWGKWKKEFPRTVVLSDKLGFYLDYNQDPYEDYRTVRKTAHPATHFAPEKYHPKENIIGIYVEKRFKAYPFIELNNQGKDTFEDVINNKKYTIYWDRKKQSAKIVNEKMKEIVILQTFWFSWYALHPETEIFQAEKE